MIRASILVLAGVALSACADVTRPRTDLLGLPEGLHVELVVEPDEVEPHAPFSARLRITNTTSAPIQVVTAHGCLAVPNVLRNERRVPMKGSSWGCTAAITTHTFPPGETLTRTWEMRAELYAENPGDVDGAPAPEGTYRVQAEFDTPTPDGTGRKPTIERTLRVR